MPSEENEDFVNALQRGIVETQIQQMEAGRFQEFVLRFLPLYDLNYQGILRNGHTEFGKTKPGVPDLLLVHPKGEQVGCECGTQEDYWTQPKEAADFQKWKPIEDGDKCLGRLDRPIEVIIAANRPIPSKSPNTKTIIIDYFSQKTKARFTIFSCTDFADWIARNDSRPEVLEIGSEFFPDAFENRNLRIERDKLSDAVNLCSKLGYPIEKILQILGTTSASNQNIGKVIAAEVYGADDRFLIQLPAKFHGIKRCGKRTPEMLTPFGKVIQLLGTPKIGKTHLCWELIASGSFDYKWFSVPIDERDIENCVDSILITVYSRFTSVTDATAIVRGSKQQPLQSNTSKFILVVDNAHFITDLKLKLIARHISGLAEKNLLNCTAIIFITNKNLSKLGSISLSIAAPTWNREEIQQLIEVSGVQIAPQNREEYLDLLTLKSCGHPLFALALARKYPDRVRLVIETMHGPSAHDHQLSKEITTTLYEEILVNADQQNFVQRLSLITHKLHSESLDCVRTKIIPNIAISSINLVEEIGVGVIDGTVDDGIKISQTFREFARQRVSPQEAKLVFLAVAESLLVIKEGTINANSYLNGVYYLTLAGELGRAANCALLMLVNTRKNDADPAITAFILNQLFYFKFLGKDATGVDYLSISSLKMMLSYAAMTIQDIKQAAAFSESIDLSKVESVTIENETHEMKEFKAGLVAGTSATKLMALERLKDPNAGLIEFIDLSIKLQKHQVIENYLELLPAILFRLSGSTMLKLDFTVIPVRLFDSRKQLLAKIGLNFGISAAKNSSVRRALQNIHSQKHQSVAIFKQIAMASMFLELGEPAKALSAHREIKNIIDKAEMNESDFGAVFFQHRADVLAACAEKKEAIQNYVMSTELEIDQDDFVLGWNYYQIGLASDDNDQAIKCLKLASEYLTRHGSLDSASRALGAAAARYLSVGQIEEAIDIANAIAHWLYSEKRLEVSPAMKLLQAFFVRKSFEIHGKEVPNPENFPEIDPDGFRTLLRTVRIEHGGTSTYYSIARLAAASGRRDLQIVALIKAINSDISAQHDRDSLNLCWFDLFNATACNEIDLPQIRNLLTKILVHQPAAHSRFEEYFFFTIMKPFEEKAQTDPQACAPVLLDISLVVREIVSKMDVSLSSRWTPYLDYVEGLAYHLLKNDSKAYAFLCEATRAAIADKRWIIGENASFLTSFTLWESNPSIKDAARRHYELFLCREGQGLNLEHVSNLGINMFRFWSKADWRRLSTSDLLSKQMLLESAVTLRDSGFSEGQAAPIMIGLLLKLFDHQTTHPDKIIFSKAPPTEVLKFLK